MLNDINVLLTLNDFKTSNIYDRSCFDILARKDDVLIILKIFRNIDSLTQQQAEELSKVAGTFLANPIIIGLKSKHNFLEEDVVYERYELPVISPQTLCNIIVNEIHPEILSKRGGYYVKVDGNLLREVREKNNLSLKELADLSHVSRETIYKYEQGNSQTYPETIMMLEEILQTNLAVGINLLSTADQFNKTLDEVIKEPQELINLGYDVKSSSKTPFDAISERKLENEKLNKLKKKLEDTIDEVEKIKKEINKKTVRNNILITNMERQRNEKKLNEIAEQTKDIAQITQNEALFVLEDSKDTKVVKNIPSIYTWELENMDSFEDLKKLLKERKQEVEEL
ncbi:MAG: transcriptional regulator [Methanosphaera sp.]|uniref:transcriptional regulator n=1 Tax=Methanosphaera sp. TaxID=2666342 RepID=UPI0025DDC53E|nr:transcriptional regulator [Methanosphaera sp.]MCI5867236.1 transcriptional regulator [Methanosphaera sp.]MDD6534696.1 transcriptional regulator [Methanosphaera sp.]MDY3955636.1 transcriptional regulator [Methanosphaera sp.]